MIRKTISTCIIIVLWELTALWINNAVILPMPIDVFFYMIHLLFNTTFYMAILSTLLRVAFSFLIAMVLGTVLGLLTGLSNQLEEYLAPIMSLLQTIPQIAYILILLVWFDAFSVLVIIVCLMLIPIFYHNVKVGIQSMDQHLKDVMQIYQHSLWYQIRKVYLPMVKPYLLSATQTGLPLSFKIGVMAEIFVQTKTGIGTKLYFARTQIDMTGIFAWTLWMVILLNIFHLCLSYLQKRIN